MKKEALFAIFAGVIFGLGITYGIYFFRQRFVPQTTEISVSPTIEPSPFSTGSEKITITAPENEAVLSETTTTISGTVESNEMVIVSVNDRNSITQADDIGAFAVETTLDAGSNVIVVTALAQDGTQKQKRIVVIVSTASLDETTVEETPATSSAKPTATPKATP